MAHDKDPFESDVVGFAPNGTPIGEQEVVEVIRDLFAKTRTHSSPASNNDAALNKLIAGEQRQFSTMVDSVLAQISMVHFLSTLKKNSLRPKVESLMYRHFAQ